MVQPIGYDNPWDKFENDVFLAVKEHLGNLPNTRVEWNYLIDEVTPDVALIGDCSCAAIENCEIPLIFFEATRITRMSREKWRQKDKQMIGYSRMCSSILVTPGGYAQRPYCKSADDQYRIISFQYLHLYKRD